VALANGWPAVIALASVSSAEIERDDEVPESLYQFFAEEVFHALGDDVRTGLTTLSQLPIVERELAVRLLSEASDAVLGAALDVGILVERESSLEMHPLARAFLEEWRERSAQHTRAEVVETALGYYTARRDWDASFELLARNNCTEGLERLTRLSLDELLETARLSTIDAWCDYASEHDAHDGIYSVARAEVALRYGRLTEAQAFAEVAALADTDLVFRGLSLAGRAAHLATREDDALDLFRRAERAAERETDRRDALWGQFLCALELELPDAALTLQSLKAGVAMTDARDVVRAAACDLGFRLKFGELDLTEAERALQLMHAVADPLVTTSFQNVYGHALALSARYREALQVVDELLYSARKYRLAFVTPYGLASAALSKAGLRQWEQAREHLDEADAAARATRNGHAEQLCCACRLRLLAQEGKHSVALSIELPGVQTALPAIRAELLSSQALVLVVADRVDEASRIIDRVRGTTSAIEPTVLISAVDAIAALKLGDPSAPTIVERLEREVFGTGATDLLVTAYRASPELLATLLRVSVDRDRLWRVIRRIGDDDLTRALGIPIVLSHDDRRELLTRREREVYELLCQGLTNRQIASSLFISEATVKLHAHHIYDKLGTRSRRALAIQAALERSDQATSATRGSDTPAGEDSS
jgi:ATP/maltotriose-dependent transcriptional regulator MalT